MTLSVTTWGDNSRPLYDFGIQKSVRELGERALLLLSGCTEVILCATFEKPLSKARLALTMVIQNF